MLGLPLVLDLVVVGEDLADIELLNAEEVVGDVRCHAVCVVGGEADPLAVALQVEHLGQHVFDVVAETVAVIVAACTLFSTLTTCDDNIFGFKLDDVRVEHRPYQYLYEDPTGYIFMNQETFEQIPISKDMITGWEFMKEGDVVDVQTDTSDGTILSAEMPVKTNLKVTHSEPGVKGNTATNATKPATLETGAEIRVPLFINEGETITVDTRDGSYVGRVSEK